jgi:uncharacterized protein (DUF433 family)
MRLPPSLTEWPFGEIVLTGHRITLYHIMTSHRRGLSPEQIQERFPTLAVGQVREVLAFYRDNRAEVDAYVSKYSADLRRQRRRAQHIDIDALRFRAKFGGRDMEAFKAHIEQVCAAVGVSPQEPF